MDDSFRGRPPAQRAACDAAIAHLRGLGPIEVEAVQVGVFVRRWAKVAELRPNSRWLLLGLQLPRRLASPRIQRSIALPGGRHWHYIRLLGPDDVDAELRAWLTEAYVAAE